MNAIKGLLLKDLLNLQKYMKTMILSLIFVCMYGFLGKGFEFFISLMPVMVIGMTSLSTFSYDELSKADKFILSLPTKRKDLVKAKYILIISLIFGAAILSSIIATLLGFVIAKEMPSIMPIVFNSALAFLMLSLVASVQIPSVYKWGAEKGRIIMVVVMALFSGLFAGGYFLLQKMNINIDFNNLLSIPEIYIILIILGVGAFGYFISYLISNQIFSKKEL